MKKGLLTSITALALYVAVGTVNATVFYIDEFTVTENGQTYWRDTFSDGLAPTDRTAQNPALVDENLYNRAYLTRPLPGLPGPEENGRLAMDSAEGLLSIGVVNQVPVLTQRARVSASTNSANASALIASDEIVVTGLFDLIEPELSPELYSIRLTDWSGSVRNEALELAVINTSADQWVVEFRQADIGMHWDPIETWALEGIADIADYEQIALSLFNDPTNGGETFSAQFTLFDLDGILSTQTYTSSTDGLMFQVSDWLRPEFTVRQRAQVPEPSTLALLALGLFGVRLWSRKLSI